jgi:hypothetical protein
VGGTSTVFETMIVFLIAAVKQHVGVWGHELQPKPLNLMGVVQYTIV